MSANTIDTRGETWGVPPANTTVRKHKVSAPSSTNATWHFYSSLVLRTYWSRQLGTIRSQQSNSSVSPWKVKNQERRVGEKKKLWVYFYVNMLCLQQYCLHVRIDQCCQQRDRFCHQCDQLCHLCGYQWPLFTQFQEKRSNSTIN